MEFTTMTADEYTAEARRLFGDDAMQWKFVCPICATVISVQDYKDAGAPEDAVGFNCIGRYLPEQARAFGGKKGDKGPCDYTSGGLIRVSPIKIGNDYYFDFARTAALNAEAGEKS